MFSEIEAIHSQANTENAVTNVSQEAQHLMRTESTALPNASKNLNTVLPEVELSNGNVGSSSKPKPFGDNFNDNSGLKQWPDKKALHEGETKAPGATKAPWTNGEGKPNQAVKGKDELNAQAIKSDKGTKGDVKAEVKGEAKGDTKGDAKGGGKGDSKGDIKGEGKGESKGDSKGKGEEQSPASKLKDMIEESKKTGKPIDKEVFSALMKAVVDGTKKNLKVK